MATDAAETVCLRGKNLTKIPEDVLQICDNIAALDLSRNPRIELDSSLRHFTHLRDLNLSDCDLTSIPEELCGLTELQELDLSGNDFSDGVLSAIARLVQLRKLNLRYCCIKSRQNSIFKLQQLQELNCYGANFTNGLPSAIRLLVQLKKLDLRRSGLESIPDKISDLQQLEEILLGNDDGEYDNIDDFITIRFGIEFNDFSAGISQAIWQLKLLKKLDLCCCNIAALPDSIGDLAQLKNLDLRKNKLKSLPSTVANLQQLEELLLGNSIGDPEIDLYEDGNDFSDGIPQAIWQLKLLKKLDLCCCNIAALPGSIGDLAQLQYLDLRKNKMKRLPDRIGNLQQLEELLLGNAIDENDIVEDGNWNDFSNGISPAIGRLKLLTKLDLFCCNITALPDSIGDLEQLTELDLKANKIPSYPRCTIRLKNLRVLDLSYQFPDDEEEEKEEVEEKEKEEEAEKEEEQKEEKEDEEDKEKEEEKRGNRIRRLPIELAHTSLHSLELEGNPITEPPPELWQQGIKAIKSFMQALGPGRALMHADTLNMIGDTGAGKTSLAQSLVAGSPRTADIDDRTRVLQQFSLKIDETLGHSVNINDFGGHDIYHSVMPIFLPVNGLVIIVVNLNDEHPEEKVKKWLLTAIAKSSEVRAIIVGTHADEVADERSDLEKKMDEWSSNILESAKIEVVDHICHLNERPNDEQVKRKAQCLKRLHKNLQKANISVVALSCLKTEDGQSDEGLSNLFNLVLNSLRPPKNLPIHWCKVMNGILDHNGFYITMEQVEVLCKTHFTDADNSETRATILRYLSKTSQIIWLENHKSLSNIVFHSPLKIIDLCKCIVHHDGASLEKLKQHYGKAVEEYENGILTEPPLMWMLNSQTKSEGQRDSPSKEIFNVVSNLLQELNLTSCVTVDGKDKKDIITCKLSSFPTEKLKYFENKESSCLKKVVVKLSFMGSMIPMSFFENSLSSLLTVAGDMTHHYLWRDGLIIFRDGVYCIAKRRDSIITLSAFSDSNGKSPWTLLRPMLKRLHNNVTWSWYGAPPHCAILCPCCVQRIQHEDGEQNLGEIQSDLMALIEASGSAIEMKKCMQCTERDLLGAVRVQERTDENRSTASSNEKSSLKRMKVSAPAFSVEMASDPAAMVCLSDKNLTKIPEDVLQKCDYITVLNLSRNPNIQLHTYLRQFTHLRELDLRECDLTSIPDELCQLTELEELLLGNEENKSPPYFQSNRISNDLISAIMRLTRLKKLHLRRCDITDLPDTIGDLQELQELDLSGNYFSSGIPSAIARLAKLKKLDLQNCHIRSLPNTICNLQQLEELNLCGNKYIVYEGNAHALQTLVRLRKLDLSYCQLMNFPDSVGYMEQLQVLHLSGNWFHDGVPSVIGQLKQLQKLDLQDCTITSLPDSIYNLQQLKELNLNGNLFFNGVPSAVGLLVQLKTLDLRMCNLTSLTDTFLNLQQLEALDLGNDEESGGENWNDFSNNGVSPAIGRLTGLKYLNLSWCEIRALPSSMGDMKALQELDLNGNNFSDGIPSAIWQLVQLKKLDVRNCKMKILPDAISKLKHLLELDLNGNDFSDGIPLAIWQLVQLKKLDLRNCKIKSLSAAITNLQQLEELLLGNIVSNGFCGSYIINSNDFSNGISEAVAQLIRLKKLDLSNCNITTLPDAFKSLEQLTELSLEGNRIQTYPLCTLRLNNLRLLDLSNRYPFHLNRIEELPTELASTSLKALLLKGNPITEPPEAIWTQGIEAIKLFMRDISLGGSRMCADTLNMIGETGAGKSSLARSLVHRSPHPTEKSDRTQVLDQLIMPTDENGDHSVNINDFGGHDIYQSVIPIFLPVNGLVILVFNLNDKIKRREHVRKWLFTAIAKSSEIRVIIVGAHADEIDEPRLDLEFELLKMLAEFLESAAEEMMAHIVVLSLHSDGEQDKLTKLNQVRVNLEEALADFSRSAIDQVKKYLNHLTGLRTDSFGNLEEVGLLLKDLQKFAKKHTTGQKNVVRFLTLSCLVTDEGLDKLHRLVQSLLHPPASLPIPWCRVMNDILKQSVDNLYITMKQVEDICQVHIKTSDDRKKVRETILRYLAETSQIIWHKDHTLLCDYIFHSPKKIIDTCKKMLYHDRKALERFEELYESQVEAYHQGILREPLLSSLLRKHVACHISDDELAMSESRPSTSVVLEFMENFNILSQVKSESGGKEYIIPCNLGPETPSMLKHLERVGADCLNRVIVELSFLGSIIPMSLFETSLSLILTAVRTLPGCSTPQNFWRDGIYVFHEGVHFIMKRRESKIRLEAFSEISCQSPWTVLHPVLNSLGDNVRAWWHGAPPQCSVICPVCARRNQPDSSSSRVGKIEVKLTDLADTHGKRKKWPMCSVCSDVSGPAHIPQSLCYATVESGSFINDEKGIEEFFRKFDRKRSATSSNECPSSKYQKLSDPELLENLRLASDYIAHHLTLGNITSILLLLTSAVQPYIQSIEKEDVEAEKGPIRQATKLLDILKKKSANVIRTFEQILRDVGEPELADLLRYGKTKRAQIIN